MNALFAEFFDRLVYFSFQLIKDKDHARDIAQDAFIKYWNARETVAHNPAAVKNYLYSTVRNDSLNAIRHSKVVTGYIDMQDKGEPEVASIIEAIISAEVMAELHTALQSLPSTYRTVSTMSYLDGKKNQEIADELNMSVNTIKKQKQKAMQLLRLRLEPEIFVVMFAVSFLLIR
ncbi:RNA polymerase sigma-70 factor [Mucilaginibacter sp.]|uniref:RNA polymerase sigma-70 factor n=1 Tax=Mucilaginibacter sp. TaxID=1882438 RepID=UPI003D0F2A54